MNSPSKPSPRQAPRSSWELPAAPLGAGGTGVAPAAHTRLPPPQCCSQLLSQHKSLQQTLTLRASRLHQQSWVCRRAVRTGSLRWRSPGFVGLEGTQPVAASPLPRSPGSASSQPRATPTGESVATPQGKREQPPGAGTGHPSWGHTAVPWRAALWPCHCSFAPLIAALSCGSLCLPPPPSAAVCPFDPCLAARAAAPPPACFPLLLGCEEQCLSAAGL